MQKGAETMEELLVYSLPSWPECLATKEFFRQKGVAFQEFDLSKDQAAVTKMLKLTRQKRVPVIQKGERFVVGFLSEEIEKLIDS